MDVAGLSALSAQDRDGLSRLDGREAELLARVTGWAQENTGSFNAGGLARLAPQIAAVAGELPGQVTLEDGGAIPVVDAQGRAGERPSGPVVQCVVRPQAPVQIVLTGHYDTVFAPEAGFNAVREIAPGVINGPGVTDMKGGLVVMLAALRAFEAGEQSGRLGYRIVITPDEEIGNPVSARFLEGAARAGAMVGLTYEPTLDDGSLASSRKGSGNFSLVVHGRAAHAGRAHGEGRSAIAAAAAFVLALEGQNGVREGVTFNTGKIEGGGPNNQVPDVAVVRFNIRAPDDEGRDWALGALELAMALTGAREGIHTHLHGGFTRPPKPVNAAQGALFAAVEATGRAIGLEVRFKPSGGVCEGNNLFAHGVPNVDSLGVRGGRIHSHEEFLYTESLIERARLSVLLLNRLADGRMDAPGLRAMMGAG